MNPDPDDLEDVPIPPPPIDEAEYEGVVTDDGAPVDSFFVEKQQRLLVGSLYDSWEGGKPFIAVANVGLFASPKAPPLCPNVMVSLGVRLPNDLRRPSGRAYFVPVIGKVPDVVIEILTEESGAVRRGRVGRYATLGVPHCVLFDPDHLFGDDVVRGFRLTDGTYHPADSGWFANLRLGLRLWQGEFEMHQSTWLRWCDREGRIIPTACERVDRAWLLREELGRRGG